LQNCVVMWMPLVALTAKVESGVQQPTRTITTAVL